MKKHLGSSSRRFQVTAVRIDFFKSDLLSSNNFATMAT